MFFSNNNQIVIKNDDKDDFREAKSQFSFSKYAQSSESYSLIQRIRAFPFEVISNSLKEKGVNIDDESKLGSFLSKQDTSALENFVKELMSKSNLREEPEEVPNMNNVNNVNNVNNENVQASKSNDKIQKTADFVEKEKNTLISNLFGCPPDEVEHYYGKITGGTIDMENGESKDQLNRLDLDQLKSIYQEIQGQYADVRTTGDQDVAGTEPSDDMSGYNHIASFQTEIKLSSLESTNSLGIDEKKYPNLYKFYNESYGDGQDQKDLD